MKNKIIFLIILAGFVFPSTFVSAHLSSSDPYGIQLQYNTNKYNYEYCEQLFLGNSYSKQQIEKFKSICRNEVDIKARAQETKDKTVCNELAVEIKAWRELINSEYKDAYGEERMRNEIENCYAQVAQVSFLDPTPSVRVFDLALFYITSGLSLIYLFAMLWLKSIRGLKLFILPIVSQVLISAITGFIAAILHIGLKGPIIAPLHDFLFFQQQYFISIIITGVVVALLSFLLIRLLLRTLKDGLEWRQRRTIAIFYALVFNPFFFPIGLLIGFMNVVYTKKSLHDHSTK
jgi:hypothetical protein